MEQNYALKLSFWFGHRCLLSSVWDEYQIECRYAYLYVKIFYRYETFAVSSRDISNWCETWKQLFHSILLPDLTSKFRWPNVRSLLGHLFL